MNRLSHLATLAVIGALAFTFAACPDKPKPDDRTDGGALDGGADGGSDGGADAGDGKCHADTDCLLNEYCELASGKCLGAKPCRSDGDCDFQQTAEDDYCANGSCFCDLERNAGSCRPRFKPCTTCTRDIECGADPFIYLDYVAKCVDYKGAKTCLPQKPLCPPGYVPSVDGTHCEPGGGSCDAQAACAKDDDCDPYSERPVCDKTKGFCVPACIFDYQKGTSDDCPPGQFCHVDPRLLSADNGNFGGGKCGKACEGVEQPFTCGEGMACEKDGDKFLLGEGRPLRCRPPAPKCVRDADCPADPATHSRGYCDRSTLECKLGCRRESDCDGGFKCLQNQCVEKTCIENGGAALSCVRGAFCCGEENSFEPCPTGVSAGQCYDAPNPPWCGSCQGGAGEVLPPLGGGARPAASRCWTTAGAPLQWHSCDPKQKDGVHCPRARQCDPFLYFCTTNADCGPGGECGEINAGDLGTFKGCLCNNGQNCPGGSACNVKDGDGNAFACEGFWCSQRDCLQPPP